VSACGTTWISAALHEAAVVLVKSGAQQTGQHWVHDGCILSICTAKIKLHTCSVCLLCLFADWTVPTWLTRSSLQIFHRLSRTFSDLYIGCCLLPVQGSLLHPLVATVLSACKVCVKLSSCQRHLLTALDIVLSMTKLSLYRSCSALNHLINAYDDGFWLHTP